MDLRFYSISLLLSIILVLGTAQTTPKPATCSLACGASEDPVCGSNGVTYKNNCRYDCAKTRNMRLRVIQRGKCGDLSLGDFRRGQKNPASG